MHFGQDYRKRTGATIKCLCLRALAVVLMGGVLAGLIALKTVAFLWRLHY